MKELSSKNPSELRARPNSGSRPPQLHWHLSSAWPPLSSSNLVQHASLPVCLSAPSLSPLTRPLEEKRCDRCLSRRAGGEAPFGSRPSWHYKRLLRRGEGDMAGLRREGTTAKTEARAAGPAHPVTTDPDGWRSSFFFSRSPPFHSPPTRPPAPHRAGRFMRTLSPSWVFLAGKCLPSCIAEWDGGREGG